MNQTHQLYFQRYLTLLLLIFSLEVPAAWFTSSEVKEYIKSANDGDAEAAFLAGEAFDYGRGARKDKKQALKYYLLAAEANHLEAQNSVASLYQELEQYNQAVTWYRRATDAGHVRATHNLAYLYDLGLGVPQNRQKARDYYKKAAESGSAESMWNLANMYGSGQLGDRDLSTACMWTYRASAHAAPHETELSRMTTASKKYLASELSNEELEECQRDASTNNQKTAN